MKIKFSSRIEQTNKAHITLLAVLVLMLLTEIVISAMSWLLKGSIVVQFLMIGFVASLLVSSVIVTLLNRLCKQLNQAQNSNKHFTALIEAIPDAIFLKDAQSRWLITNETAKQLFKLHEIDWQGRTEMELAELHPELRQAHENCLIDDEKAWQAGQLSLFSESIMGENGLLSHFEVRKMPVFDAEGRRQALVIIGRNITEQKQAEDQLRIAAAAFETHEAIVITDAAANVIRVNQAFERITGYNSADIIGKKPNFLKPQHHNEMLYTQMWQQILSGYWHGELWDKHKSGRDCIKEATITAVKNTNGETTQYVCIFNDITQRKEAEKEIKYLAFFDQLTGLPNRRLLQDRLKQALAASHRNHRVGAVLFIDMDNFKSLNDTRGHDIGDLLLQQVAQRLESCMRKNDTAARLGGDEFVVLLEDLSKKSLEAATQTKLIGEKILTILNQPYQLATFEHRSTPSIGAVLFKGHEQTIEELLKRADIAMYQAKTSGRNTLRFFDPQMQTNINNRVALETELRTALQEQQFLLHYQMQVNHQGHVIGAEALIRWQSPQRGMVSPLAFIPLAEETNLILPIGTWVLETACAQLKAWKNNLYAQHLQLSVNVSAKQFYQSDFVTQVCEILSRNAIKPNKLKLEITESLLLDNLNDSIEKMNALQKIGVTFSIDDFGTGYSSLAYLTQLPLDQLKIDQSFVRNIGLKPSDAVIVQTIIGMANNLGIEVIAEGVETQEQRIFLEQQQCKLYQGYLFSKPAPLEAFENLLLRNATS